MVAKDQEVHDTDTDAEVGKPKEQNENFERE